MRPAFLLFFGILSVPIVGLAAESDPLHLTGSRVRLAAPELGPRKQVGTIVELRADTLLFTAGTRFTRALVPTASLTGLEVSQGMHSHVLAGAGLGFLAGAVVGGIIGGSASTTNNEERGLVVAFNTAIGAAIGGGAGAVVGVIVGSRHTERWQHLHLPISIGILPGTDTIGLSVELTNR